MNRTKAQQELLDQKLREGKLLEEVNLHGHNLFKDGHHETAASLFHRCMVQRPEIGTYAVNYASVLWHLGRYEEGIKVLEENVKRWPGYDDGRENLGKTYTTLERFAEAEEQFTTVINRRPDNHRVKLQRAFCLLDQGKWKDGLDDYEARRHVTEYQTMPMPTWEGEDLTGKTLYVQSEQGAGDCLLFSRYLWWIKQKWPTCTLKFCCAPPLMKVLWGYQARGILTFMPEGIPWSDNPADYGTFLASLPRIHGTRPDNVPLDPGLIEQRCVAQNFALYKPELGDPLKVGVCWTGNPEMKENARRSIPVDKLIRLSGDPRWLFYSLQVGPGRDELYSHMGQESICDLAREVGPPHGFVATGACMAKLDLVITVCTSMAHLAGAMGVPTWLLLSKEPYWIWGRRGETTPWYPSMEIFRQPEFGDWDTVLAQVERALITRYDKIKA